MSRKNTGGFEAMIGLIFLISVVCFVGFYVIVGCVIIKGNYWLTEKSALSAINVDNPEYVKIISLDRNVKAWSVVLAETKNGDRRSFSMNTNVCQDVNIVEPDSP